MSQGRDFGKRRKIEFQRRDESSPGSIVSLEDWLKSIPGLKVEFHRMPIENTLSEDVRGGEIAYGDTIQISLQPDQMLDIPELADEPLIERTLSSFRNMARYRFTRT